MILHCAVDKWGQTKQWRVCALPVYLPEPNAYGRASYQDLQWHKLSTRTSTKRTLALRVPSEAIFGSPWIQQVIRSIHGRHLSFGVVKPQQIQIFCGWGHMVAFRTKLYDSGALAQG